MIFAAVPPFRFHKRNVSGRRTEDHYPFREDISDKTARFLLLFATFSFKKRKLRNNAIRLKDGTLLREFFMVKYL